jgi:hypothetical protein
MPLRGCRLPAHLAPPRPSPPLVQASKAAARGAAGAIDAALSAAEALDYGGPPGAGRVGWGRWLVTWSLASALDPSTLTPPGGPPCVLSPLALNAPTHPPQPTADAVNAALERLAWRGEALQGLLAELLTSCFALLNRLSEVGLGGMRLGVAGVEGPWS